MTTFGVGFGNFFGGSLDQALRQRTSPPLPFRVRAPFSAQSLPFAGKLGWFGKIFLSYGFLAYAAVIIAFICAYILRRTRIGLQLRAVGRKPQHGGRGGHQRHKI